MDFTIQYNNEEYLIILTDFFKTTKTAEVFRFSYSDIENDWIEYEIQVFVRQENDFYPKKFKELPESLKEIITKEFEESIYRTFIANPYFDELLILENEVYTYQEELKPIECNQCGRKDLYEKRNKGNKSTYISNIVKLMEDDKNPDWPFSERLLVQFTVSNVQTKLDKIDLDNLAKTIFDTFKGLIYIDDSQIVSFAGSKDSVNNIKAFMIAIKRLEPNEKPVFQEYLFSGKLNAWQLEHEKKRLLNKPTRFKSYGKFEDKRF